MRVFAEKPRFFRENARPYGLKRKAFQTEIALGSGLIISIRFKKE